MLCPSPSTAARFLRSAVLLAGLTLLSLALPAGEAAPLAAAPEQDALERYRLVDTWADRAWEARAGSFRDAVDISSLPDGRLVVLDARYVPEENMAAVHLIGTDGVAERMIRLPAGDRTLTPDRLDVGPEGDLYILWTAESDRRGEGARLERWTLEGTEVSAWWSDERYVDVAVRQDGRVYLARSSESFSLGLPAVEVFDENGRQLEQIRPPEMDTPIRLDLAEDGILYVLQEVPPPPTPREPGGPRPPPGPSGGPSAGEAAPAQDEVEPVPGVLIFDPAHAYQETVPFDFGIDVDAGPAGVFVARYGQAFALREDEPITPLIGQTWTGEMALEVPAGGGLYGSLTHCEFEGLIRFADPALRPAPHSLHGRVDHPSLEGPVWPLRVAAGDPPSLLQGRFGPGPAEDLRTPYYQRGSSEPPSVQRWSADGRLEGQLGLCDGAGSAGEFLDIALDDTVTYAATGSCVERRPGEGFADWRSCLDGIWGSEAGTRIAALAAEGGQIAVLDAGGGGVALLDEAGSVTSQWRLSADDETLTSTYVDIDLSAGRLVLADAARARLELRDLDGGLSGAFDLIDRPQSVAFGPQGRILVLGQGGWGMAYSDAGTLLAAWRLPDPDVPIRDLAVLDDGRVLVSFARAEGQNRWSDIEAAGVWVFAPEAAPPEALPPGPRACVALPDKVAAPARIPLGDSVEVTLSVDGHCPAKPAPLRLMIVFDTSRSMGWGYALDRAKRTVIALLGQLDPNRVEVGLVTFDDDFALVEPPSRDLLGLARRTAALRSRGDTLMSGAIDLAQRQLPAEGLPEGTRRAILVVTDANPSDATLASLDAASAEGIALSAVVVEDGQPADPAFLESLDRAGGRALFDPALWELPGLAETLLAADPNRGLFETIEVIDDIPANMRYIEGSAQPPADFDAAANRLTWRLGPVEAAAGLRLRYDLEPLEVGIWPTNVRAEADYVDASGHPGDLLFPVPQVEVYEPRLWPVYLPILSKEHCARPLRPVDVILVLDKSSSMAEPATGAEPGGPTKLDAAREAATTFVSLLDLPGDRAAVISFDAEARRELGLTGDLASLRASLDALETGQGTRIDLGLEAATSVLTEEARPGALPVVILLTDGLQEGGDDASVLGAATALKAAGGLVFTIGLGASIDADLLARAASDPDRFYASPGTDELSRIYDRISVRLACE